MSCNYAEGLSPYDDKGVLGTPERFDDTNTVEDKCKLLTELICKASHVVLHTGAGISTSAGIPDFRGPNGVWTLEKKGEKPAVDISFQNAVPTVTHMAIKKLVESNFVHYVVSQNIDGLHLRSGIPRKYLAELHGNMFIEECDHCESKFVRSHPTTTVGKKCLGVGCRRSTRGRTCRGKLHDTILDWENNLPEDDLQMSDYHSSIADLNICLGTTLQIVPSGQLPLKNKKFGGKFVVINLQPTKHDKKADLIINSYVDNVLQIIMQRLQLDIPAYSPEDDPIYSKGVKEWSIDKEYLKEIKTMYDTHCQKMKSKKTNKFILNSPKFEKVEAKPEAGLEVIRDALDPIDLTLSDDDDCHKMVKCAFEPNTEYSIDLTLSDD